MKLTTKKGIDLVKNDVLQNGEVIVRIIATINTSTWGFVSSNGKDEWLSGWGRDEDVIIQVKE